MPWARPAAARPLITEFHSTKPDLYSLKWAIGNALDVVGDESVAEELIAIAKDRRHGDARQMVVWALGRLKKTRPIATLLELVDDRQVAPHAINALGRLQAEEALFRIEPLLNSDDSLIRKEAAKALTKIRNKRRSLK